MLGECLKDNEYSTVHSCSSYVYALTNTASSHFGYSCSFICMVVGDSDRLPCVSDVGTFLKSKDGLASNGTTHSDNFYEDY